MPRTTIIAASLQMVCLAIPTVMFRAGMDALAVREETDLPFKSKKVMADRNGEEFPVGQPAEEIIEGAVAMVDGGLFDRVPKPDIVIAGHNGPYYPTGSVAIGSGRRLAGTDQIDLLCGSRTPLFGFEQRLLSHLFFAHLPTCAVGPNWPLRQ